MRLALLFRAVPETPPQARSTLIRSIFGNSTLMASAYSLAVAGSAEVLASVEAVQALAEAAGLVAAGSEVSVAAAEALASVVVPYQVKAYQVRMSKSFNPGPTRSWAWRITSLTTATATTRPVQHPRFLHCKNGEHSVLQGKVR